MVSDEAFQDFEDSMVEAGAWKRKTYDLRKKEPKEGYAPQEHCKEFGHSFQVVQDMATMDAHRHSQRDCFVRYRHLPRFPVNRIYQSTFFLIVFAFVRLE